MNTFKIFVPLLKASRSDDGKLRFHGIASSSVKDRHGDVITRTALSEMERSASENMTIFLNHEYKVPEDVAGSVERAFLRSHPTDPDIQDLSFDIVVNQSNPRAVSAWEAIDNGTKLGLSIGARIPDGGATRDKQSGRYVIDHIDLLETSIVGVPANPRSWVEYAVKSLNVSWADEGLEKTGDVVVRSDGEVGIVVEEPEDVEDLVAAVAVEAGTGEIMEGLEVLEGQTAELVVHEDGTSEAYIVEGVDGEDVELAKAKKPAGHTHPHAHEHDHGHEHWNGIVHSHEHNHTHAHEHDDGHEHIDDRQGSEHDHSHMNAYGEDHAHDEDGARKDDQPTVDDLAEHLEAFEASLNPTPDDGDGAVSAPQEAPTSGPENGDDSADTTTELDLQPTFAASMRATNEILKSLTRELIDAKTSLAIAEQERDQAMELAQKAIGDTASLLERLSATPLGRKTVVTEAASNLESLKSVYGEAFMDLLKKDNTR